MTAAPAPDQDRIVRWLDHLKDWRGHPPDDGPASILIGGPVRCGKSSVARAVAAATGMLVLPTDVIDRQFCRDLPPGRQRPILQAVLGHVLRSHPRGVILEGVMLFDRAPWLIPGALARGLPVYAIGYADGTPEAKRAHVEAGRAAGDCWTLDAGLDEGALVAQASYIVAESRVLRRRADRLGHRYLELDSARFGDEVARLAALILNAADAATQPDNQAGNQAAPGGRS